MGKKEKTYGIYCYSESDDEYPVFWSNRIGWGNSKSATKFTKEEKNKLNLPMSKGNDAHWFLLED